MDTNTIANIATAVSIAVVAILGYLRSRTTEKKLDHVTVVVNQRFTDLENYVVALRKQIIADGGSPIDDQSKGS
jgi:hypothetical protein